MNELPIMPIRAKYADETSKGVNIDEAIEDAASDVGALNTRVESLETTVGDAEGGLVKDVSYLQTAVAGKTDIASVQALIEGGTVSNAKPIWYHPIYMIEYTQNKFMLCCVVLNNSSDTITWADFVSMVEGGFRLSPVSGTLILDYETIDIHSLLFEKSGDTLTVYAYGRDVLTDSLVNAKDITSAWNQIKQGAISLTDSVNKIN